MEFSELLIKEHEPIRRAINVLRGMVQTTQRGLPIDRHDVNALLIFLHYFADACHQSKEENILFPILRQSERSTLIEPALKQQLQDLLTGHSEERSLIEKTQLALFSKEPSEFTTNAQKLIAILSGHALKEEQMLFPIAEEVLSEAEANEVVTHLEEADAEFGSSQRTLLIELLQELETKYLRKAA